MVVHSVFQSHGLSIHLHWFTCALMSTCRWIAIWIHLALCFAAYERSVGPATPGFVNKRSEWLGSYAMSISGSSPLLRGSQQTKIALITTLIMSCSCARLVSCTSSWGSKKHAEQTVRRCATSRNVQCVALGHAVWRIALHAPTVGWPRRLGPPCAARQ